MIYIYAYTYEQIYVFYNHLYIYRRWRTRVHTNAVGSMGCWCQDNGKRVHSLIFGRARRYVGDWEVLEGRQVFPGMCVNTTAMFVCVCVCMRVVECWREDNGKKVHSLIFGRHAGICGGWGDERGGREVNV